MVDLTFPCKPLNCGAILKALINFVFSICGEFSCINMQTEKFEKKDGKKLFTLQVLGDPRKKEQLQGLVWRGEVGSDQYEH